MKKEIVARSMDVVLVKNNHTLEEIDALITAARKYEFACTFMLPCYMERVAEALRDMPQVHIGGVIGFPYGGEYTETKIFEAKGNLKRGATEMDMCINFGMLLSDHFDYVRDEIRAIKDTIGEIPLKCIIEIPMMDEYHAKKACELVVEGGADYVKTGTGFVGATTIDQIKLMKSVVGDKVFIKAAGGIRKLAMVEELLDLGVKRIGMSLPGAITMLETECE